MTHWSDCSGRTGHQMWLLHIWCYRNGLTVTLVFFFFFCFKLRPAWGPWLHIIVSGVFYCVFHLLLANCPAACRFLQCCGWEHEQWPQHDQTSRWGNFIEPEDYRLLMAGLFPMLTSALTVRFFITRLCHVNELVVMVHWEEIKGYTSVMVAV